MDADLRGRRAVVLGLGLFGGGVEAARFLCAQGARVRVADRRDAAALAPSLRALEGLPIELLLGCDGPETLEGADLAILNPAFRPDHPAARAIRERGIPFDLEIGLFLRRCPARVLAVTGTNGKSTTTALLAHLLRKAQRRPVHLGGNIGVSLLPLLPSLGPEDFVCLEISSAQLFYLEQTLPPVEGTLVTNFTPDHLDFHRDLREYAEAKRVLLRRQGEAGSAVLNADDPKVRGWGTSVRPRVLHFSTAGEVARGGFLDGTRMVFRDGGESSLGDLRGLALPGRHNQANLLAAATLLRARGVRVPDFGALAADFRGLEHRLEEAGSAAGVRWLNDSVSTTPEAALAGLRAVEGPVVLLVGGKDKGLEFDGLAREALARCRAVVAYGAAGGRIEAALRKAAGGGGPGGQGVEGAEQERKAAEILRAANLREALELGRAAARPGDAVLFSPACSSFDEFPNFAERGSAFKRWVGGIAGPG